MGDFITGFITIIFGVAIIYMGALEIIGSILPKDVAEQVGRAHGEFIVKLIRKEQHD